MSDSPKTPESNPKRSIAVSLLQSRALWGIALVIFVAWVGLDQLQRVGGPAELRARWGMAAMVPLILLHAVTSVSPFPGEVIAFGNSMLFGFGWGVFCNWSGWFLAALIQYALVRRAADDLDVRESKRWESLPRWLRDVPLEHPLFLICGRWLPFGAHIVNTAAGCVPVSWRRHAICAAVGIVPVAIVVAAFGSGLAEALWPSRLP